MLVIKRVFRGWPCALQAFSNSIFSDERSATLPGLHQCPAKRKESVNVSFQKRFTQGGNRASRGEFHRAAGL